MNANPCPMALPQVTHVSSLPAPRPSLRGEGSQAHILLVPTWGQTFSGSGPSTLKPSGDFPGGAVDKNLPASAGNTDSIPGLERFHKLWSNSAREPQQLRLCATTTEAQVLQLLQPTHLGPVLHKRETTVVRRPHTL